LDLPGEHQSLPDTTEYNLLVEKYSLQGKDAPGKRALKKTKSRLALAGMWRINPEAGRRTKFPETAASDLMQHLCVLKT
jgi:hypothetical protein